MTSQIDILTWLDFGSVFCGLAFNLSFILCFYSLMFRYVLSLIFNKIFNIHSTLFIASGLLSSFWFTLNPKID
jgi:hypothetical protein